MRDDAESAISLQFSCVNIVGTEDSEACVGKTSVKEFVRTVQTTKKAYKKTKQGSEF
jgi:hypothetical protein